MGILDQIRMYNQVDENTGQEYTDQGFNIRTTPGAVGDSSTQQSNHHADNLPLTDEGIIAGDGADDEALFPETETRALNGFEEEYETKDSILLGNFSNDEDEIFE